MDHHTIETLTRRLNKLERENRRLKRMGCLMVMGIASVTMMGQSQCSGKANSNDTNNVTAGIVKAEIVEVRKIVLKDRDGHVRLSLYDKNTPSSAHLAVSSGYSSLGLEARDISREVYEREEESFSKKWNSAETPEAKTKVDQTTPFDGYTANLTAWSHGNRSFLIVGRHLTRSLDGDTVELNSAKSRASVSLSDENGKDRAALGSTHLKTLSTGALIQQPVSSLVLFDEKGKVIWQAPR